MQECQTAVCLWPLHLPPSPLCLPALTPEHHMIPFVHEHSHTVCGLTHLLHDHLPKQWHIQTHGLQPLPLLHSELSRLQSQRGLLYMTNAKPGLKYYKGFQLLFKRALYSTVLVLYIFFTCAVLYPHWIIYFTLNSVYKTKTSIALCLVFIRSTCSWFIGAEGEKKINGNWGKEKKESRLLGEEWDFLCGKGGV